MADDEFRIFEDEETDDSRAEQNAIADPSPQYEEAESPPDINEPNYEGGEPDYDDPNYTSEDPNAQRAPDTPPSAGYGLLDDDQQQGEDPWDEDADEQAVMARNADIEAGRAHGAEDDDFADYQDDDE